MIVHPFSTRTLHHYIITIINNDSIARLSQSASSSNYKRKIRRLAVGRSRSRVRASCTSKSDKCAGCALYLYDPDGSSFLVLGSDYPTSPQTSEPHYRSLRQKFARKLCSVVLDTRSSKRPLFPHNVSQL